jgi:hypothetical protein
VEERYKNTEYIVSDLLTKPKNGEGFRNKNGLLVTDPIN